MRLRPGLWTFSFVLCLAAGAGRAQFVEDSVDVGGGWVGSLAYNSREDVIYGASEDGVFFAISCDSNKLIKSLPVSGAFAVEFDSIDNKAYCTFGDSLLVVDGATHSRIKSLPMEMATDPVWDPMSDRVYVSCQTTNKVAVVDCTNDSLLTYITVGACPIKIYINTLRHKLYVLNYDDGTVSLVNMTNNQVIKTLFVGGTPNAGYYSLSADKFYSAGAYGYCTVIDGAADSITARIPLQGMNADIRSATGNETASLVYLATDLAYVATVRTRDDSLLATSTIGGELWGITSYDKSGLVYCASSRNDAVYVISTDGEQVLATLSVGDYPHVFAVAPQHDRLYVGHLGGTHVYVLRDTTVGVLETPSLRLDLFGASSVTPNPFSHSVAIVWNSYERGGDVVRVFAQDGRLTRSALVSSSDSRWIWNGRDDRGDAVAPGVYVVQTSAGRQKIIKLSR